MEFDLSTFALEIVNFLVLIWILQRLFYKPVQTIIARRKQHIDQSLAEAAQLRSEAEELKNDYGNRLQQWEQEKHAAMTKFHQQLEAERQQQLIKLQEELQQERNKVQTALQRQQQETQRHQQLLAMQNGARFAALLLKQAAGPELEARLVNLLIEQLQQLPEACQQSVQAMDSGQVLTIRVSSAYPLSENQVRQLENKFTALIDKPLQFRYRLDPELIAGLKIDKDAWVLQANVQQELRGFAEFADDF